MDGSIFIRGSSLFLLSPPPSLLIALPQQPPASPLTLLVGLTKAPPGPLELGTGAGSGGPKRGETTSSSPVANGLLSKGRARAVLPVLRGRRRATLSRPPLHPTPTSPAPSPTRLPLPPLTRTATTTTSKLRNPNEAAVALSPPLTKRSSSSPRATRLSSRRRSTLPLPPPSVNISTMGAGAARRTAAGPPVRPERTRRGRGGGRLGRS
jgi:hypothetical protein